MALIDAKAQVRQDFKEQIALLRKENSSLKMSNN